MGTVVGSYVFNKYGWRASAALSLAWTGWMLLASLARGPHVPRYTWLGYKGGCEVRKHRLAERARAAAGDPEAAPADTDEKTEIESEDRSDASRDEKAAVRDVIEPEKGDATV